MRINTIRFAGPDRVEFNGRKCSVVDAVMQGWPFINRIVKLNPVGGSPASEIVKTNVRALLWESRRMS